LLAINLSNAPSEWELAMPIYVKALCDIPPDLLCEAVMAHICASEWFPKPVHLRALVCEKLDRRRRQLEEFESELMARNQPFVPPPGYCDPRSLEEIAVRRRRQAPLWGEVRRVANGGNLRPFSEVLNELGLNKELTNE
jgi:hypothetical protein